MGDTPIFTYRTRLRVSPEVAQALDRYGAVYGSTQRSLFASVCAGKQTSEIKSEFSKAHKITARLFNAVRIELDGKIASIKERRKGLIKGPNTESKSWVPRS